MKISMMAAGLLLALGTGLAGHADAAGPAKARTQRGDMVHGIVAKWAPYVQEAYGISPRQWAAEMGPAFAKMPVENLVRAAAAPSFDGMNDALVGAAGKAPPITANAIGNTASDLVYVPITPCRILDTRLAGGAIAANTVRGVDVTAVSDYSFQGGAANDCGIGAVGSFAAVAVNLTVVTPGGAGYITAFPLGTTQPNAATVNYTAGSIVGNYAVVKLDQGAAANEMNVYSFANTHLVADVVGYFSNPAATVSPAVALDCVEAVGSVTTIGPNGGTNNVFAANCPAGYTRTAVQCRPATFALRLVGSWTSHCNYVNEGTTNATADAVSNCCRVPQHAAF